MTWPDEERLKSRNLRLPSETAPTRPTWMEPNKYGKASNIAQYDEPNKALWNPKWNGTIQRMWIIHKQGAMVRPYISIVVNIEGFSLCKDGLLIS